jgi:ferredoxin-NADP reductase
MELTLIERRPEAGDGLSLVFARPAGFRWTPGQYVRVELTHPEPDDRGLRRWFTIASAPHEDVVRLTTRTFTSGSTFKRSLLALQPGDTITVASPGGSFTSPDPRREHLFIAGGIGITPFRSILADLDRRRAGPPITLLYGSRRDVVFREDLDAIAARNSWLTIRYVLEPAFVDGPLLRELLRPEQLVWISGPEVMVHALHGLVAALGVRDERVKLDEFPGYDDVTGIGIPPRARPTAAARG